MTIYRLEHEGQSYGLDILTAYAVTRIDEDDTGHDTDLAELPVTDFRDGVARQIAEEWAAECLTELQPSELHAIRHTVRRLLPDPDSDEQGVERVLRQMWTRPGRAVA